MEANFGLQMNITVASKECMFIPVLMISGQASDIWAEYSLYRDLKKKKKELAINLFFMSPHFLVGEEVGRLK